MRSYVLGCGVLLAAAGCAGKSGTPVEGTPPAPGGEPDLAPAPASEPASPTARCDEPGGDVPPDRGVAHRLQPEDTIVGCTTRGDVDMYMLTAPTNAGGSIVIVKLTPEVEMSPIVELYDEAGKSVFRQGTGKGEALVSWAHVDAGTDLFIRVAQGHGISETYALSLTTSPLDEAGEPNDSQDTATAGVLGVAANGYLSGPVNREAGLVDWYRFPADRPGKYTVLADIGGEVAAQVEVYDAARKRLAVKGGGRGERLTFDVKVARPGDIFISLTTGYTLDNGGKGTPPHHLATPYVLTFGR